MWDDPEVQREVHNTRQGMSAVLESQAGTGLFAVVSGAGKQTKSHHVSTAANHQQNRQMATEQLQQQAGGPFTKDVILKIQLIG